MNRKPLATTTYLDEAKLSTVLPCRTGAGSGEWQHLHFALNKEVSDAIRAGQQRQAPSELLVAALALVESRLTGEDQALATSVSTSGLQQAAVDIEPQGQCAAWQQALRQAMSEAPPSDQANASPTVWAVLEGDAVLNEADPIASQWRIGPDPTLTGELRISCSFRAPLTEQAVTLVADCVCRVLAGLAENRPIESIDLLDPGDRARQLGDWGRTPANSGLAETVTEQFAAMLARAPEAIAVVDGARSLSYAELDRRANIMAARLIAAGVQPGSAVGVSMSRSAATVIAVLGILKAGAAYLPIDRAHPRDRVSQMLDNAGVQVAVVDDAGAVALLPERLRCVEVSLDQDSGEDSGKHSGKPAPDVSISGDSIAYVMYTSGSTGEPKGVEIRHRGILRLVCGVDYASFGPHTRYLQVAPLGFDASTLELWAPLLNGGCVVVHPEPVPTGAGIAASISKHRVTTTLLTAALLNAVVDEDPLHLAGLEELLSGGEAMSIAHVRRLRAALPALRLVNCYGPTECTVIVSTHEVGQELPADASAVPIGRPIADTRVYVLNARRELVPTGVLGELYVGGGGLARGYANQEQLTAGRFVSDPFRADERLYRTGDQVRFLPDGTLEFAGRGDSQVKIRGFRIELSEIEQALQQHPGIQSCAVVARPGRAGGSRLLAYYVAGQELPAASALRAHLASRLPAFMVPVRYLCLDALPVTINGKLDTKALPEPDRSRPELACAFEPATGAVESEVCDVFGELLDIDAVGRNDNFFELGGNSLLAVQLAEKLAPMAAARSIPVTLVFRNPTPATLAAALGDGSAASSVDPARIAAKRLARAESGNEPIAIIGMAGRFPGAGDVETFWENLCAGRESITRFEPGELDPAVSEAERSDPAYVRARGVTARVHLALSRLPSFRGVDAEALRGVISIAPDLDYIERAYDDAKYGRMSQKPLLEVR
ncbi:MAG: amino acid adenylation domain-containing protein, partial [Proteobacteria bacterium]|nr:amino acid adenylation domain-containing protein [Pseudomonadota bacterium]